MNPPIGRVEFSGTSSCCVILSVNRLISYICVLRGNHTGRVFPGYGEGDKPCICTP